MDTILERKLTAEVNGLLLDLESNYTERKAQKIRSLAARTLDTLTHKSMTAPKLAKSLKIALIASNQYYTGAYYDEIEDSRFTNDKNVRTRPFFHTF